MGMPNRAGEHRIEPGRGDPRAVIGRGGIDGKNVKGRGPRASVGAFVRPPLPRPSRPLCQRAPSTRNTHPCTRETFCTRKLCRRIATSCCDAEPGQATISDQARNDDLRLLTLE